MVPAAPFLSSQVHRGLAAVFFQTMKPWGIAAAGGAVFSAPAACQKSATASFPAIILSVLIAETEAQGFQ